MRIDKFLNAVCITKRRAVAEDMCRSGVVFVGDSVAKPSKDVRVGDVLTLKFSSHTDKYKILAIPTTKNIPKNEQFKYVEKLESPSNLALNIIYHNERKAFINAKSLKYRDSLAFTKSQNDDVLANSSQIQAQNNLLQNKEFILAKNELNTLCELLPKCAIILLCGDLASGKTTLVQALAQSRGVKEAVNSPTFSIMQSYESVAGRIFHYDIYSDGFAGLVKRGLAENLFEDGLHLIEWGDEDLENYLKKMSLNYLKISIFPFKNKRRYEIYGL